MVNNLHDKHPTILDPLKRSIELSMNKYNKTKDPASVNAIKVMRGVIPRIHPLLQDKVDLNEIALMEFKESLKLFKPKQSILELGIVKT